MYWNKRRILQSMGRWCWEILREKEMIDSYVDVKGYTIDKFKAENKD